ncbi:hypothetical protein [Methylobacterium soli]|uniref:Uncharacterized protein n=1 Tax=Methylobacterium soli TaxID=553447 RepID=A0A6L3ST97_9HYPH|nr:hypothetical protein [Methylobacterium soli]KAB1071552.1 hypothetical protein F6X53_28970 [Methylobacterium soli]GJE43461.1 hypothetical protein AEGHOMDF_2640 [Methylobacterium soli]
MAKPVHRRLSGADFDTWLIATSRETVQRSRALLERTRPSVATEPPVSHAGGPDPRDGSPPEPDEQTARP